MELLSAPQRFDYHQSPRVPNISKTFRPSSFQEVKNIMQMNNLLSSSFQSMQFWNLAGIWGLRRLMRISADQINKVPDIFAPVHGNIPDAYFLSSLFCGGCATLIPKENLVGFIKLIHTAIRSQSHINPSQTCLLSSIQTRLKLVSQFLLLLNG